MVRRPIVSLLALSLGLLAATEALAITPAQIQAIQYDVTDFDYRLNVIQTTTYTTTTEEAAADYGLSAEDITHVAEGLSHLWSCHKKRKQIHDLQDLSDELDDAVDVCAETAGDRICEEAYSDVVDEVATDLAQAEGLYIMAGCMVIGPY